MSTQGSIRIQGLLAGRHERHGAREATSEHDMPWAKNAACLDVDPELFFPTSSAPADARKAKAICNTCPVLADCFLYALKDPSLDGIWGASTAIQRANIRKQ